MFNHEDVKTILIDEVEFSVDQIETLLLDLVIKYVNDKDTVEDLKKVLKQVRSIQLAVAKHNGTTYIAKR